MMYYPSVNSSQLCAMAFFCLVLIGECAANRRSGHHLQHHIVSHLDVIGCANLHEQLYELKTAFIIVTHRKGLAPEIGHFTTNGTKIEAVVSCKDGVTTFITNNTTVSVLTPDKHAELHFSGESARLDKGGWKKTDSVRIWEHYGQNPLAGGQGMSGIALKEISDEENSELVRAAHRRSVDIMSDWLKSGHVFILDSSTKATVYAWVCNDSLADAFDQTNDVALVIGSTVGVVGIALVLGFILFHCLGECKRGRHTFMSLYNPAIEEIDEDEYMGRELGDDEALLLVETKQDEKATWL